MDKAGKRFISFAVWGRYLLDLGIGTPPPVGVNGGPPAVTAGPTAYTSLPVPVRSQGQLQVAFMVCPYVLRATGSKIWTPCKVARYDPVNNKLISEVRVLPADFGQTDSPDQPMTGNVSVPSGMSGITFDNLKNRMFDLYDVLFEAWAVNPSTGGHGKLQGEAREFVRIFDQISAPPLRPYYDALGREYFGWVRAVAK
ncbi:MAG: hypothetical protein FWD69_16310 [Polyangiaceae bacterium]|nr:hypothetical protein [Polyangiaceae bacterium]